MTALYILAGILLVCLLIGQIRVGVRVLYDENGPAVFAWLGALRLKVFPLPKKEKKPKKKKTKKNKKETEGKKPRKEKPPVPLPERVGGALAYARALLPVVLELAGKFLGGIRIDTLYLELTAGSPDPADAVMLYGQAQAALGALWYPLTGALDVKDGHAWAKVDFDAPGMRLYAEAALSLKIGRIVAIAVYCGVKALAAFLRVRRARKIEKNQRKAA